MGHYNHRRQLRTVPLADYWKAYRYLRKHAVWMQYADYRGQGMPIGSGVTEAACKTVFTERLKRSGMTWSHGGGQVILDLRVLVLSSVWPAAHEAYLRTKPQPTVSQSASKRVRSGHKLKKAA